MGKALSFLDSGEILNNICFVIEIKGRLFAHPAALGWPWEFVQGFRFGGRETRKMQMSADATGCRGQ